MIYPESAYPGALWRVLLCVAIGIGLAFPVAAQEAPTYFIYQGKPKLLTLDPEAIAIRTKSEAGKGAALSAGLANRGFTANDAASNPFPKWSLLKTSAAKAVSRGVQSAGADKAAQVDALIGELLKGESEVEFASPVFRDERGGLIIVTPRLLIGFKAEFDLASRARVRVAVPEGASQETVEFPNLNEEQWLLNSRNGFAVLARANQLATVAGVAYAEPDMIVTGYSELVPNDPLFGQSWALSNPDTWGLDLDAKRAWDVTTGNPAIIVLVLDSGVQSNHPDLNWADGKDFTPDAGSNPTGDPVGSLDHHGTWVAGCIAQRINNAIGTAGIAPGARIASARIGYNYHLNGDGSTGFSTLSSAVSNALNWGASIGARVSNNSNSMGSSSSIDNAYASTRTGGMIHFASAGNSGANSIAYPASNASVNAVGSLDQDGTRSSFSQYGAGLSFMAPGRGILTTDRTGSAGGDAGDYDTLSGTSFSSPYAAGVAALALSENPSLTAAQLEVQLRNSCVDLGNSGYDTGYGYGLLSAYLAVEPDLNFTRPPNWTTDIVVANAAGASADTTITSSDNVYVSAAPGNDGRGRVPYSWVLKIYVDNVEVKAKTMPAGPARNAYYTGANRGYDLNIGHLSAGTHTIRVALDTSNSIEEIDESAADNERTKTIIVAPGTLPNLTASSIVVSTTTGTDQDSPVFRPGENIYLDLWMSNGPIPITTPFNVQLWVDEVLRDTFAGPPSFGANSSVVLSDYNIGSFFLIGSSETHTLKLVVDSGGAIAESNEGDNQCTKTFTVTTPKPGSVSFDAATYNVNEDVGIATITATRSDGNDGAIQVHFSASDGTAMLGTDYYSSFGYLKWLDGESGTKSFTVQVINSPTVAPTRTVALTLDTPTGGAALDSPANAVLAIADLNTFTLAYVAGPNGSLSGAASQSVPYGGGGTPVTAVAATGYHFADWSDGSTANPRRDSNVTAARNVTANFAIDSFTLTYTAGQNGTINGSSPQTVTYGGSGTAVTAVPATGYHFVDWSDGSTANPRTDTNVTASLSVTANFAINTYTLSYAAGPHGSISGVSPQNVSHGGSGSAVTAVPATGYHFLNWSDGSTANPRAETNVTGPVSVTANFAINSYALTYVAGANGSLSGATAQSVTHGGSGTAVTANAAAGYIFSGWSDGSGANPRTDTNVTGPISVTANFVIGYTLTYAAGAHGTINGASSQSVPAGGNGTAVTAMPATGYHFLNWSDGSTANPRTDTNLTAALSVTANFEINSYTLTYTAGPHGTLQGTSPQTVTHGGSGTAITAAPETGYLFTGWNDGSTANPRTDTNVTVSVNVTANFALARQTLTLTVEPANHGTIVANPLPDGDGKYAFGTVVMLTPNGLDGYEFDEWTGDGSGSDTPLQITMDADQAVTANFLPPPDLDPGAYYGLVQNDGKTNAGTGTVSLKIMPTRSFTATVILGGVRKAVKGNFDIAGQAGPITVNQKGRPFFDLSLQLDRAGGSLSGTVNRYLDESRLTAKLSNFDPKRNPAPLAGRYTLMIGPDAAAQANPALPHGTGVGDLEIKANGIGILKATMADGAKFSRAAGMSEDKMWPLYALLYKNGGFVAGWTTFTPVPGKSAGAGALDWVKPLVNHEKFFAQPFTMRCEAQFSSYLYQKNAMLLPFGIQGSNAQFSLSESDVAPLPAPRLLTLGSDNKVANLAGDKFKMAITLKTGRFSGSFPDSQSGKPRKFNGVIFQEQQIGAGWFEGNAETGGVLFEKAP